MMIAIVKGPEGRQYFVGPLTKRISATKLLDILGEDYPEEADAMEAQNYQTKPLSKWVQFLPIDAEDEPWAQGI